MSQDDFIHLEKNIALKPYLETIADECSKLTRQELSDLIIELARSEPASRRGDFLCKLRALLPDHGEGAPQENDIQYLLDEVLELKEDIEERMSCIERGDYEDLDEYDWEDFKYEPDFVSEGQIDDIEDFFHTASDLFVYKNIIDAKKMYNALFQLLDDIAKHEDITCRLSIDIKEERARYARCVYDAPNNDRRLEEFAQAMVLDVPDKREVHIVDDRLPLFQDVIDAEEEEMQGIQAFFREWKELLENYDFNVRAASLLIEAVHSLEGIDGVARLARTWGSDQPYGYIFWLGSLMRTSKMEELITVSGEALQVLKPGGARERVCDYLIDAGKTLGDSDYVLKGFRQKFFSRPCDRNLLALLNEARQHNKYELELSAVVNFWAKQDEMREKNTSLYVKSLLLAGKLDDAFELVKTEKSIGWSYGSNAGLVFAAIALFLVDWSENAIIIRELLAGYADRRDGFEFSDDTNDKISSFYEHINRSKDTVQIVAPRSNQYWEWVFAIGRNRIEHIVSNKYRNAYRKAAQVLGVLAEMYAARGEDNKGKQIIREYCQGKYNRHVAFKREVQEVLKTSGYRLIS
ncbi:MAG: hypothetical protein ACQERT_14285 [Thermodesulfobacteriota bacterium]